MRERAGERAIKQRKQNRYSTTILLKKLYPYAKPDTRIIVVSLVALGAVVVAEMGMPILIQRTLDAIVGSGNYRGIGVILRSIVLQYFGLLGAILLFTFMQSYLMAVVGQRIMLRVRRKLFAHILNQSVAFFSTRPVGAMISRITNDVEGLQELFGNVLTGLVRNIATIIGILITMSILNLRMTLLTMLAMPVIIPIALLFSKILRRAAYAVREATANITAFISEHIAGIHIVHIFSQQKKDRAAFTAQNYTLLRKMMKEVYTNAIFRPLLDFFSAASIAYIFIISSALREQNIVTIGVVAAFLTLITRFFQQLTNISDNFLTIQSGMSGLERIFFAFDEHAQLDNRLVTQSYRWKDGLVRFNAVSFSYTKQKPTIDTFNCTISPGETVAIVGYTGSGKTTIANLLCRAWDVDHGAITIDGADIRSIPPAILHAHIAMAGQQISLFDDTILENIRIGRDISDRAVMHAAQTVQADHFIQALPDGYRTVLKNNGTNISVGQRQLLSFARVIAQDPKILILDEATAEVDSNTEKLIQDAIARLLHNRSALVIAHRLSTIQNADKIIALANGKIVESGTHAELMKKRQYYYTLWSFQFHH